MPDKLPYEEESNGRCPHCGCTVFFDAPHAVVRDGIHRHATCLGTESGGDSVHVYSSLCPNCRKPIVATRIESEGKEHCRLVHPYGVVRIIPSEVPKSIQEDFLEAAAVTSMSEKASAALSRRCLQNLLSDRGYKGKDLNKQIDAALKDLPTRIGENLDAIRNIGNFAAHPIKFKTSGIIVDVEPEEANWNLDVLEQLFDFYYVQPKKAEEKRQKLEAKLKSMGKQPLKKP